mmetsp:Transcript_533/g.1646  ORF Transcript_533/g.1646 Transcript_533/m.1646 type:complete len:1529 (+) Transcript_533:2322-6908(+)
MTLTETPRWMTTTTSTSRTRIITVDASASVRVSEEPPSARVTRASKRQKSEDSLVNHASSSALSSALALAGGGRALRGVVYAWEFDEQNHSVCVTSSAGSRVRVRAPSALATSCALTRGDETDSTSSSRFVCATEDGSCVISIAMGDSRDLDSDDVVHVARAPVGVISRVAALGSCGASGVVLGGTNGHGVVVHARTLATMCELKEGTLSRVWSGIKGEVGQAIVDVTPHSTPLGGKELVTTLRADGFVQVWDVTAALKGGQSKGAAAKAVRVCASHLPPAPGTPNPAPERLALALACAPAPKGYHLNIVVSSRLAPTEENPRASGPGDATLALYTVKHGSLVYVSSIERSKGVTRALALTDDVVLAAQEKYSDEGGGSNEDPDVVHVLCWPLNALHRAREVRSGDVEATELADWGHSGRGNAAAAELLARFGQLNGYTPSSVAKALSDEISMRGLMSEDVLEIVARTTTATMGDESSMGDDSMADATAQDTLLAAAAAAAAGCGGKEASVSDVVRAWCRIAPEYARAWRRAHAPIAFITDAPTLLLRGGGLLSALRVNGEVEDAVLRAKITNEDSPMLKFNVTGKQAVAALTALFSRLNAVLGTSACSAMDLIASGLATDTSCESKSTAFDARDEEIDAKSQNAQDWLESFAGVLTGDVFAQVDSGESEAQVKIRKASHRAKQRLIIRLLQDALSNIPEPEHALRACVEALEVQPSGMRDAGEDADVIVDARGETTAETVVLNAARQHARACLAVSRGMILLLGCIRLGPKAGFPTAALGIVSDVLPRAMHVYRSAVFTSWLLTARRTSAEMADPPRLAVVLANVRDDFVAYASTSEELQIAGHTVAAHIATGNNTSGGSLEVQRVVEIGTALYAAGEVDALGTLLAFARQQVPGSELASSSDAPALLFLQALWVCADLAGFNDAKDAERRSRSVDSAISLFSRSAAFIPETSSSGGVVSHDGEQQRGQQRPVDALLVQLLRVIRSILIGCDDPSEELYPGDVVSRLEYYEVVMLFFERLGCAAGASAAAYAALHEVVDDENQSARLWANVLQYAIDAKDWRGAYCAATSAVGDHRQAAAMRRLVAAVCSKGAKNGGAVLSTLCLDDNDRHHYKTVANALEGRAATSPIDASPAPSDILYAFYVSRGEPAKAAIAMRKYGLRLRVLVQEVAHKPNAEYEDIVDALSKHASALLASANALAVVADALSVSFEDGDVEVDEDMDGNDDLGTANVVSSGVDTTKNPLATVLREYALSAARLELLHAGGDAASLGFERADEDPAMISALSESLIEFGCFAAATTLCTAWLDGERLTSALTIIAATLAARASMRQIGDARIAADASAFKRWDNQGINVNATAGLIGVQSSSTTVETYWSELRSFIERFDTPERNFALAEAAARAILSVDARVALPSWLTHRFINPASRTSGAGMARRAANPAALLRTYLAFNLVEDAAQLSLKELNAWSKRSAVDRTAHAACWFPMHLILEARDRCAKDNTLKSLHTTLTAAIDAYEARAKSDSDMLLRVAA